MTNSRLLKKINSDKVKYKDICSDSRIIKKGDIFFAIPGSNVDGLKYVNDAVAKGASAIVIPIRKKNRCNRNEWKNISNLFFKLYIIKFRRKNCNNRYVR